MTGHSDTEGMGVSGRPVLPPMKSTLRSVDDLLTEEEQSSLLADLREIARCRRRAESEAALWPMN